MLNSLYAKIIKVVVLLVLMTALFILLSVWNSTSKTVHRNIYASLQSSEKHFSNEINDFKQFQAQQIALYFSNIEHSTITSLTKYADIKSTFTGLLDEVDYDLVLWRNQVISISNQDMPYFLSQQQQTQLANFKRSADDNTSMHFIMVKDNKAYIFLELSLFTSSIELNTSASSEQKSTQETIYIGYLMGQTWIDQLSHNSRLNVSLLSIPVSSRAAETNRGKNNDIAGKVQKAQVVSSIKDMTIDPRDLNAGIVSPQYLRLLNPSVLLGLQKLFTAEVKVENVIGGDASFYLSINATRVSSNFVKLQLTIAGIALLAVVIAVIAAVYLARKIAKPLELVTQYSAQIAQGNYSNRMPLPKYSREVNQLITSFDKMQTDIIERQAALSYQAEHDSVTKIYNRKYVTGYVEEMFNKQHEFQAIVINISYFRHINDVFGFELGDHCLIEFSKRLQQLDGVAARLTGGKFILLPLIPLSRLSISALHDSLNAPIITQGITIPIKLIIGYLTCPEHANNSETFFRRLAIVLESAKTSDTTVIGFSLDAEHFHLRKLEIITHLRKTLSNKGEELSLVYQPKLAFSDPSKRKLEALLRWNNPQLGSVPPEEFIRIAEDAGLINELSFWVIEKALEDVLYFESKQIHVEIAINISVADVLNPEFLPHLIAKTKEYQIQHNCISLELTESLMASDPSKVIACLVDIKNSGFSIAIDDFGTGYSSLSYLSDFPADTIKIDRSFVMTLSSSSIKQTVCKRIIQLAKDLNIEVVAEGIEDQQALDYLKAFGCDWGQGYFISRPADKNQIVDWYLKQ